jgi:hypothetical protein
MACSTQKCIDLQPNGTFPCYYNDVNNVYYGFNYSMYVIGVFVVVFGVFSIVIGVYFICGIFNRCKNEYH